MKNTNVKDETDLLHGSKSSQEDVETNVKYESSDTGQKTEV